AHQWLLVEEFKKLNTQLIFLQNPFGDTPQGKLLTQMQGMIAEYERTQILERTRRGRLEKAQRGEFIPWAFSCYGYRYLPKQHGGPPQVMIELEEAEVVRGIYRALVEEQLSCRQITKRLNESKTPTPSGKNQVWQANVVRNILTNRVFMGVARYNYRQQTIPKYRKVDEQQLRNLKTVRCYRPETEWVISEAPAIITSEEDVTVTVSYTVSGQPPKQESIKLTVQKPTKFSFVSVDQDVAESCSSTEAGRRKVITWQLVDHLNPANPISLALPTWDDMIVGNTNTCGLTLNGTPPTDPGAITGAGGQWTHKYHFCSTVCVGGTCQTTGNQRYKTNGFTLTDLPFTFSCNSITVDGH